MSEALGALVRNHGQARLLRFWDELDAAGRTRLTSEIGAVDFPLLDDLIETLVKRAPETAGYAEIEPIEVERGTGPDAVAAGEAALAAGEVAVVLVAGGQGTRLGFDGPRGTFPVGPVSGATLFQMHAEKVVALERRYGRILPLLVMTSPVNDHATRAFFGEHGDFGLGRVRFFVQGRLPAVERRTGGCYSRARTGWRSAPTATAASSAPSGCGRAPERAASTRCASAESVPCTTSRSTTR
jgi:UDP-N-acetylglucosamine/UDP-N-acetylgalactosamine diphosphorylase